MRIEYLKFIDSSVYSPRQQFRIVGCQKWNSGRPKLFNEVFTLNNVQYTHRYAENVSDPIIKELTILYESLLGFTNNCSYLPSYIPPKRYTYVSESLTDLDDDTVNYCMHCLQEQMNPCPFIIREIQGNRICLKREAPSYCPIHNRIHENDHPYMFIKNGKIYWDCRRDPKLPKFLVGYLAFTLAELQQNPTIVYDDDIGGTFTFGDYDVTVTKDLKTIPPPEIIIPPLEIIIPSPETRTQNVIDQVTQISKTKDLKKEIRQDGLSFDLIKGKITPDPIQSTRLSGLTQASNGTAISIFTLNNST